MQLSKGTTSTLACGRKMYGMGHSREFFFARMSHTVHFSAKVACKCIVTPWHGPVPLVRGGGISSDVSIMFALTSAHAVPPALTNT